MSLALIVIAISIVGFIAVSIGLFANVQSNPTVKNYASGFGKHMVTVLMLLFLIIVSSVTVLTLSSIKTSLLDNLTNSLNTVLDSSNETVNIWLNDHEVELIQLAQQPDIVRAAKQLVSDKKAGKELYRSSALDLFQYQFQRQQSLDQDVGYFIIGIDGLNLAVLRDSNLDLNAIGKMSSLYRYRAEIFVRVLNGETLFISAIPAATSIKNKLSIRGWSVPPIMLIASPIYDENNKIIAVMTKRFNPTDTFTRLLQFGRLGKTGETYAFNENAELISGSRFEDELRNLGFINTDETSILSIKIVVPSAPDDVKGVDRYTVMAHSALLKERGENINGYSDYRGTSVIGAWLWNDKYGFGLATEMDLSEAMEPFRSARILIVSIIALTSTIAIGLTLIVLAMGRKSNKFLEKMSIELEHRVNDRTEQLNSSQEKLQLVLDTIPAIVFLKDTEHRYQLVNSYFQELVGLPKEQLLGKTDAELYAVEVSQVFLQTDREVIDANTKITTEQRVPDKQGNVLDLFSTKVPITDASNKVTGLVGVSIDISERKTAERQLQEAMNSLEFVQFAVDSAAYMVIWADADTGNLVYANTVAGRFLNIEPAKAEAYNILDYELTNPIGTFEELVDSLKLGPSNFESVFTLADGEQVQVDITCQLVKFGDKERLVSFGRDISIHKKLEHELINSKDAAETANRAKSAFLASMSHEIRTPLNGVLGMLNMVMRSSLNTQQKEHLRIALSSATSLLAIINDVLDFSKIEAEKLELEMLETNIIELIANVTKSFTYRAAENNVEIILDLSLLEIEYIQTDPTRLRQVLTNLIANAVKFTEQGEIVVRASIKTEADETYFHCSISDTGIGIGNQALDTLFDSFTQADTSTTRKFGGSGLGLAICRRLVDLMGGSVTATSTLGEGSEFSFYVKIGLDTHTVKSPSIELASIENLSALIVDDNNTNRQIFRFFLERWNLKVTEADSVSTALVLLNKNADKYNLILSDMNMPEVDGLQFVKMIRSRDEWSHLKLMIMTSAIESMNTQKLRAEGVDGFFTKPITPTELHEAIMVVMSESADVGEHVVTSSYLKTINHALTIASDHDSNANVLQRPVKILLAEDNQINQLVVLGLLEDIPNTCVTVENGQLAIDALKNRDPDDPFDVVLMDCQMPEMDGYEATRNIRKGVAGEQAMNIPIIALTAHALQGDKEKCIGAGMTDFLTKPLDGPLFLATVQSYVGESDYNIIVEKTPDRPEDDLGIQWPAELHALDENNLPSFARYTLAFLSAIDLFDKKSSTDMKALEEQFSNKNNSQLKQLLHGLKGSSGNLGFGNLSKACQESELMISDVGELSALQLNVLKLELNHCQHDIKLILALNIDQGEPSFESLSDIKQEIISRLENNEAVNVEIIQEYSNLARDSVDADIIEQVCNALNDFEYDEALALIRAN